MTDSTYITALCLLIDCDGAAPYLACREGTDESQLYDVDYDAMYDIEHYEALGLKCKIIPVLRPMHGAPSWIHDRDFVLGLKQREA